MLPVDDFAALIISPAAAVAPAAVSATMIRAAVEARVTPPIPARRAAPPGSAHPWAIAADIPALAAPALPEPAVAVAAIDIARLRRRRRGLVGARRRLIGT